MEEIKTSCWYERTKKSYRMSRNVNCQILSTPVKAKGIKVPSYRLFFENFYLFLRYLISALHVSSFSTNSTRWPSKFFNFVNFLYKIKNKQINLHLIIKIIKNFEFYKLKIECKISLRLFKIIN